MERRVVKQTLGSYVRVKWKIQPAFSAEKQRNTQSNSGGDFVEKDDI